MSQYTVPQPGWETALQKYTIGGRLGLFGEQQKIKEPELKGTGLLKSYQAQIKTPAQGYFTPWQLASISNRAEAPGRIGAVQEQKELAARAGGDTSSPLYQLQASQIEGSRAANAAQQSQALGVENKQLGEQQKQRGLANTAQAFNMRQNQEYQYPPLVPGATGQGQGQALAAILPLLMKLMA